MKYEYSAENHDWDMTLHAAVELLKLGLLFDRRPRTGNMSMGFAPLTGAMLLSFAAIESFSASVAFCMPATAVYENFDFRKYQLTRNFWGKMTLLCGATNIEIDRSQGLFQKIAQMQQWRNLVTHASPYRVQPTVISKTVGEVSTLHRPERSKDYLRSVNPDTARMFYDTAVEFITLLTKETGIDPRASAYYKVVE